MKPNNSAALTVCFNQPPDLAAVQFGRKTPALSRPPLELMADEVLRLHSRLAEQRKLLAGIKLVSPTLALALSEEKLTRTQALALVQKCTAETAAVLESFQPQRSTPGGRGAPEAESVLKQEGSRSMIAVMKSPLVVKARAFAHSEFRDKCRKVPTGSALTALPYVVHLEQVAQKLLEYGYGPAVVAAGYMHDHLEDLKAKGWTRERLERELGAEVALLVDFVTQQEKGASWEQRNEAYAERLAKAPNAALAISAADKISNLKASISFMQMGYTTKTFLKQGWRENSDKFRRLDAIYENRIPLRMLAEYRRYLAEFDVLGAALEGLEEDLNERKVVNG